MTKIIGATVGTPMNPQKIIEDIPGGGGGNNLLVVTVRTENGEYVSSHTYQEIKAFVDGGGEVVLRMNYGGSFTQYELLGINDDHATFQNCQMDTSLIVASYYYINLNGTVTYDWKYVAVPSDDHINELIDTYIEEALGGDY